MIDIDVCKTTLEKILEKTMKEEPEADEFINALEMVIEELPHEI